MTQPPIGILGGGSWGTALAVHLASSGRQVVLWVRSGELARELNETRVNSAYLPGVHLPQGLTPTADFRLLGPCELVLNVVPSHGFRTVLRSFLAACSHRRPLKIVSCTKGIETQTLARMSQVCFEEGMVVNRELSFAVLSGPTFASELVTGMPTAAVVASEDQELARQVQEVFSKGNLRLYSSSDVVGVELGSAVKNVIAIAAGAVVGLGMGHNTLAALITRGLHEITRLGLAWGGRPRTFSGLAGLGDLVLTCTGNLSRNRHTGMELAAGRSLEEITSATPMVAEGVQNSKAIANLAAQKAVEMPITEQMVAILHQGRSPKEAVQELMKRELKAESEL